MLTVLLLSMALFVQGQDLTLSFQRLSVAQGLSSQQYNHYLRQDSRHFVWISSLNGLNRFDGNEVRQFHSTPGDSTGLADEGIESDFFEDEEGRVWFSTNPAIQCFDYRTGKFKSYSPKFAEGNENTLAYQLLYYDEKQKQFWLIYNDRVALFNPAKPENLVAVDTLKTLFGRGLKMEPVNNGLLLMIPYSNGGQLRKYRPDGELTWKWTFEINDGQDAGTHHFYLQNDSSLWIANQAGLFTASLQNERINQLPEPRLADVAVSSIVPYDQDRLLIATWKDGIYFLNKKSGRISGELLSLEGEYVSGFQYPVDNLHLTSDGVLWVQSEGRGIYFSSLKKRKFQSLLQAEAGYPAEYSQVGDIAEDEHGNLWCLTKAGVIVLDPHGNRLSEFDRLNGPSSLLFGNDPYDIRFDSQGRIWVCNHAGLFVLTQPEGIFLPVPPPVELEMDRPVFTFTYGLPSGKNIAASLKAGLAEVTGPVNYPELKVFPAFGKDSTGYSVGGGNPAGNQYVFSEARKSLVIFSETNGVLEADTIIPFTPNVNTIRFDSLRNCFWIGCTEGLFQLQQNTGRWQLDRFRSFPFASAYSIEIDNKGDLWVSHNKGLGLIRLNSSSINGLNFNLEDGLQSLEFISSSSVKLWDGRLAFGGVNGLNLFDPEQIQLLDEPAHPVITALSVNDGLPLNEDRIASENKGFPGVEKVILPYSQNTINLKFAALEYSSPAHVRYRISLVPTGQPANFSGAMNRNDVTFFNLREGDYTFSLMASNSDGLWSDEVTTLRIIVMPPWYRTWWFYSLIGIVVASGVYWFYRRRLEEVRKEESYKRELAELKQKEAEYKLLVAETETAILRLQMNPHFIFNSMNSINSYILKRDIGTAGEYLGRFSRLMRMILNLAAKKYITVYEEQELLDLYIQTEAMRFEDKFSYEIRIADDLDPDDVLIPTMILQPFVENAIWHGLSSKAGGGKILVEFKIENDSLLCAVEDNGIGRQAAADSQKGKKHESKALGITRKRLELLQKETGHEAHYRIIDLVEPDGSPAGTRVELVIPLI